MGKVNVLFWSLHDHQFCRRVIRSMLEAELSLFPPCCGRGASCPHLHEKAEWPNGDSLDLHDVEGIPDAFQKLLQQGYTSRELSEHPTLQFGQLFSALSKDDQPASVTEMLSQARKRAPLASINSNQAKQQKVAHDKFSLQIGPFGLEPCSTTVQTSGSERGRSGSTSGSDFDCESEYDSSSEADSEAAAIQDVPPDEY